MESCYTLAMRSDEIREKYLKFFISSPRNHREISPAPLVLESDPTTLFTSAGMQPLIPYLKGEPHPKGKRLVDSQPSLRLQDIEEVGDNRHTTFFEMLGNWSLGDYFKKEQLAWILEFFTKELGLPKEKLWVSLFEGLPAQEGMKEVPKDTESAEVWKSLGIPGSRMHFYGTGNNWWSRADAPEHMPPGEIGGPDSEIFFDFGKPVHDGCHPNCDCGRFLEIGNSVFIQYEKTEDGSLKELPNKNVDFGGGLERITAAVNKTPDLFQIDIFKPVIEVLEKETSIKYGSKDEETRSFRIIADHLRAACAIAKEGVEPSNKLQGYVLRRLIRRAAVKMYKLRPPSKFELTKKICGLLSSPQVSVTIAEEAERFERVLDKSVKLAMDPKIKPFDLYQSYGIPLEVTQEIFSSQGRELTKVDKKEFEKEFKKHQAASRSASAGMFKGGLADHSEQVTKLHTATHLLHAALREVLGEQVSQKGSNINVERLRFDFSYPQKLSDEEVKKVESMINEQIDKDLPVTLETKSLEEAISKGALHFFGEKYGKEVKVYLIGSFSREICGGPHVTHTGAIGHVRIIKQEKVGSGTMRIYATNKPE